MHLINEVIYFAENFTKTSEDDRCNELLPQRMDTCCLATQPPPSSVTPVACFNDIHLSFRTHFSVGLWGSIPLPDEVLTWITSLMPVFVASWTPVLRIMMDLNRYIVLVPPSPLKLQRTQSGSLISAFAKPAIVTPSRSIGPEVDSALAHVPGPPIHSVAVV